MDRVSSELLPPLLLDERRRQARREALLAVAAAEPSAAGAIVWFGRALVRFGHRLERADRPRPTIAPADVFDLCGCGN